MDSLNRWWDALRQSWSSAAGGVADYVPIATAAIAVMLGGWILALLARVILMRSGRALDSLLVRLGRPPTVAGAKLSARLVTLAANLAFWIVILIAAAVAARVAGLDAFSVWLDRIVDYLPTLVAGIAIALAGYLLSTLVRDVVSAAFASVSARETEIAGVAAQVAVFVTAIVIGLDQIGIDVTFLIILFAVLVGGAVLSMALAFAIGARDFVGNLIAARQLQGVVEPGDTARVGDIEGRVLEITPTSIVMLNEGGRVLVPAALFQQQAAVIVSADIDE